MTSRQVLPGRHGDYARVVAHDAYQALLSPSSCRSGHDEAVHPERQEQLATRRWTNDANAAEHLGIEVVGFDAWDPKASNYEALMNKIKQSGADGVFLGA